MLSRQNAAISARQHARTPPCRPVGKAAPVRSDSHGGAGRPGWRISPGSSPQVEAFDPHDPGCWPDPTEPDRAPWIVVLEIEFIRRPAPGRRNDEPASPSFCFCMPAWRCAHVRAR